MFFWNSLAFSTIQQMLAIWSLVPLPFLKPHIINYIAIKILKREKLCVSLLSHPPHPSISIHRFNQLGIVHYFHMYYLGKKIHREVYLSVKTIVVQDQLYIVFFSLSLLYHSVSSCCSFLRGSYLSYHPILDFLLIFLSNVHFISVAFFTW